MASRRAVALAGAALVLDVAQALLAERGGDDVRPARRPATRSAGWSRWQCHASVDEVVAIEWRWSSSPSAMVALVGGLEAALAMRQAGADARLVRFVGELLAAV